MRALVTGASSGIGRDIAIELSHKGYDLVLVARDENKLLEVKEKIKTNAEIICMDLSIEENCKKLHDMAKNIDLLVNNAGFGVFGEFTNTDLNKELNLIKTNIVAVHILTKLYLQDMEKINSGHILNVASISGFLPGPLMATYYSSKSYVVRLSQSIKEELKRKKSNVKISVLCPGPVQTNFNNVADVKFNIHSLKSDYVAIYTVNKLLKNKFLIIPGLSIKMIKIFSKIVPDSIISKFVFKMQQRKKS